MKIFQNIVYTIKRVAGVSKSIFLMLTLLAVFSASLSVLDLFMIKFLSDYAFSEHFELSGLMFYLAVYALVVLGFQFLSNIVLQLFISWFEVRLKVSTNAEIYRKTLELDIINYNDSGFYNKLHRAIKESDSRYFLVLMQLFSFCVSTITFVSVFTIYHDPVVLLAAVLNVFNYIIYYFKMNKKGYEFNKKEEPYTRLQDYMDQVFYLREYAEELRMTEGIKEKLLFKLEDETERYLDRYRIYLNRISYQSIFMTTFSYLIFWVVSVYVSARLLGHKITMGDFLVMINVVSVMSARLIDILKILPDIYQSCLYIHDIREILDYPSVFGQDGGMVCSAFHTIQFENVCFKYDVHSAFGLRDLNFSIGRNEIVAIVGFNGSGKSTMMDIFTGLLQPDSGRVLLNGRPYAEYDIRSVRKLFGAVFQDFQVYEISVAENILMRKMELEGDTALVEEALRYAGLYEKVCALEHGIHTVVSGEEYASDFSGGERQKLAIARAYASHAPILVFDEPTSALDVYAAKSFYHDLLQLRELGRTIVFTTHKLYYTMRADRILFVKDGTISEAGSHERLMSLDKDYAALYKMQAGELFAAE